MKITFYGVRGSMPMSGNDCLEFGGHTSCVHVQLDGGDSIILDSGTGIVSLGNKLVNTIDPITILVTHNHWDHIQGFPFFKPIYQENRDILLVVGDVEHDDKNAILAQMSGSNYPVKYHELPANISLNTQLATQKSFSIAEFSIETQPLSHPDGGTAYCLYGDGSKLAFVTDNELEPVDKPKTSWQQWLDFIKDADVLIHDAQYAENDMPLKKGWGHSTVEQVVKLAIQANVKQLYFVSHDPERTDKELLKIESKMQTLYGEKIYIACAREGVELNLAHDQ